MVPRDELYQGCSAGSEYKFSYCSRPLISLPALGPPLTIVGCLPSSGEVCRVCTRWDRWLCLPQYHAESVLRKMWQWWPSVLGGYWVLGCPVRGTELPREGCCPHGYSSNPVPGCPVLMGSSGNPPAFPALCQTHGRQQMTLQGLDCGSVHRWACLQDHNSVSQTWRHVLSSPHSWLCPVKPGVP